MKAVKKFALPAERIVKLVPDQGYCFATDMITVDGHKVGYMYREPSRKPRDSGWRFFSGEETQEYVDNPDNLDLYDLNTVANYDPEIIPCLSEPAGATYERDPKRGGFRRVKSQTQ